MKSKNHLFIDLECTCDNGNPDFNREDMEIIEIGCYLVDPTLENILLKYSAFVKPTVNQTLTDFCKKLTTIQQDQVDSANTLDFVINDLSTQLDKHGEYIFHSWGGFDHRQIGRELKRKNLENPILSEVNDFKDTYKEKTGFKGRGMMKALNFLKLEFEGTQHRAVCDAWNLLRIAKKIGV